MIAGEGPVISINISNYHSDAITILTAKNFKKSSVESTLKLWKHKLESRKVSVTTQKRLLFQLDGLSRKLHQNNLRQSRVKSTRKSWQQRPKTVKNLATSFLDVTDPLLPQAPLQHSTDHRRGPVSRYGHSWKSHRDHRSRVKLNSQKQDPQTRTPSHTVCYCHYLTKRSHLTRFI
jgi:hypothetical protein